MPRLLDIGPVLLPWSRSAAETYYGLPSEQVERALGDLSNGLWRTAGVAVPRPAASGKAWLLFGLTLRTIGVACAASLLPIAAGLVMLAALSRPDAAVAALAAACAVAVGSLLLLPGMALINHARRLLVRVPLDLSPRLASARNPGAGRLMQTLAVALGLGFVLGAFVVGTAWVLPDPAAPVRLPLLPPLPALLVFGAALLVIGTGVLVGATVLFRRGQAMLQPSADELRASDGRRPVLLLRSFGDEDLDVAEARTHGLAVSLARLEESIADQFRPFGPLIAIGRPDEALPQLGASRNYFSESEWRTGALDMMSDALLIAVVAGLSPGLRWELAAIARAGHQSKLLILMPEPQRRRRWEIMREALQDVPGFDRLPREAPAGSLCLHAGRGVASGPDCTILSARQSWKIDYDTAIQFAIFGILCRR